MCVWVLEACCTATPTTGVESGGCSPDISIGNDRNYHMESFSDSNDQSHNNSVQVVDDNEVEDLPSNEDISHTRLQQVLQALGPSQPDPFAPSNFDEDTMNFIPASSPKHVPLSVEDRA